MGAFRDFLTFFQPIPGGYTPQPVFTKNGSDDVDSRKDVCFSVKIATFHIPWSPEPQKVKIYQILDLENLSLDLAFNIRGHRENTPYSSSEPNKSATVNRQSGGEKLKYVVKFYILDTHHVISRMRNDDSALCLWAQYVWAEYLGNR